MSSGRTMIHGAVLSIAGMAVSMAAVLVIGKVLTNSLPQHDVGTFTLLILGADLLLILNNFGLYTALPKLVSAAREEERPGLITSVLGVQALISLALGGALLVAWMAAGDPARYAANPNWRHLFPYLWALAPLMLFATQRDSAMGATAGLNRYAHRAAAIGVASIVQMFLVSLLLWGLGLGLNALLIGTILSYAVGAAASFAGLPRLRLADVQWRRYRDAVRFSWPLHWNNLLSFTTQRLDSLLLFWLLDPAIAAGAVATYEMAKRVPGAISRLLSAALVPYLPGISERIAQGDREGAARLLHRTLSLVAFLSYCGVLALLAVEQPVIRLLFSEDYLPMTAVLWALLAGTCLAVQSGIVGLSIVALGRPGAMTLLNIATASVSVLGNLLLLPHYGMAGAGWAYVVAVGFGAVTQSAYVLYLGLAVPLRALILPQVFLAAALALRWWYDATLWSGAAALALFVALSLGTGVMRPKEFRELARAMRPRTRGG
ncbi:MAG: oligosaccharide flippase family protein [Candidatus Hydrogenedentes bacterium]|nr:oligosaccharide flippase family protein [Candidatus Hydrogenedentota bacterium]